MLHHRALAAELRALAAAVFATLLVITTTLTLIRVLGQAASGRIDPQTVFIFLGYSLLNYSPMMLNLAVFSAVLLVLTRMYRDSEMAVWSAAGLSLLAWVWPVLRFALPVVLLSAFISVVVSPWATQQAALYNITFEKRDDIARIAAGQFRESAGGTRVFYVQEVDEKAGAVKRVFVRIDAPPAANSAAANPPGMVAAPSPLARDQILVLADTGRIQNRDGQRYLVLEKGRRYDIDGVSPAARLMEFERYTIRLDEPAISPSNLSAPKLLATWTLFGRSEAIYRAELMWRFGVPFAGLVLAVLAIPLSFFNPRSGRATPFIVALLVFVLYLNLLTIAQNQVATAKLSFWPGLLAVHGLVACLAGLLIIWRSRPQGRSWRARLFASAQPSMTAVPVRQKAVA